VRVRLVVLNFNGGDHVLRCVEHLTALDWSARDLEIVVVDNASTDGSDRAVAARFPGVQVRRRARNDGFPANNDALVDLDGVDYVGLVNNDAFVEPGYLRPLVDTLEADPGLGAASPLILFAARFVDLVLEAPATVPGRGDRRELGVLVRGLRVGGEDRWRDAAFAEGSHGPEVVAGGRVEWTGARAVLRVPVVEDRHDAHVVELLVSSFTPKVLRLHGGAEPVEVEVGPEPRWVAAEVRGEPYDVVNNAGNVVFEDGYGADRGFGSADLDAYARPEDVFAWSGGAVLLRPTYLADVGLFHPPFFLYYEDTDLAWRGRARGWRHRFVPDARVRHVHAATTVEDSPRFRYYTERNRLLLLARNAPGWLVRRELRRYLAGTWRAFEGDVLRALAGRRRPNPRPAWRRCRALLGFLRLVPTELPERRRLRRRRLVADDVLLSELTPRSGDAASGVPS
jgi:GT2 family glycosyltransferase